MSSLILPQPDDFDIQLAERKQRDLLVSLLTTMRDKAEKGELVSLKFVGESADGIMTGGTPVSNAFAVLGAVTALQADLSLFLITKQRGQPPVV